MIAALVFLAITSPLWIVFAYILWDMRGPNDAAGW